MRALVQRVATASVVVDDEVVGQIEHGYLVLVCAMQGDTEAVADWLAQKVVKLRVLKDGDGRMNRSLLDVGGSALVVSQFTLAAETRVNRPGFSRAALPEQGRLLYERFAETMSNLGVPVVTGIFGADMKVSLVNDGPVTIWLDTDT